MIFWNNERLDLSNIAVYINSFSQLYYLTSVLPPLTRKNALTHVVSKMFAGIGLLDVVDNTASAVRTFIHSLIHCINQFLLEETVYTLC